MTERALSPLMGIALTIAVVMPAVAQAQSTVNVAVGYSMLHELESGLGTGGATYPTGWIAEIAGKRDRSMLTFVGEVGGDYRRSAGVLQQLHAFLGGVRVSSAAALGIVPFAQMLVGLEQYSEPGFSERGLALQPGGGVQISITHNVAARAQLDFRVAREQGETFKELRVVGGVVFSLR